MSHQPRITASLKMVEFHFGFEAAKNMLYAGPGKRPHAAANRSLCRAVHWGQITSLPRYPDFSPRSANSRRPPAFRRWTGQRVRSCTAGTGRAASCGPDALFAGALPEMACSAVFLSGLCVWRVPALCAILYAVGRFPPIKKGLALPQVPFLLALAGEGFEPPTSGL